MPKVKPISICTHPQSVIIRIDKTEAYAFTELRHIYASIQSPCYGAVSEQAVSSIDYPEITVLVCLGRPCKPDRTGNEFVSGALPRFRIKVRDTSIGSQSQTISIRFYVHDNV